MTKAEFIDAVKNARGIDLTRKETETVVNAVFEVLGTAIRRDKKFTFPGFGRFAVRAYKARNGRDPRTQEEIRIPARKTVAFNPSPKLKRLL